MEQPINSRIALPFWLSGSFALVASGAALSSGKLIGVMHSVRNADSSGLLSVGRGIAEANQPVLVALYVSIICGALAAIIRVRSAKSNPPPPAWLSLAGTGLSLFPVMVLWIAESMMLNALPLSREGVVPGASTIEQFLFVSLGGGLVLAVILLVSSILRVPSRTTPKRSFVGALLFGMSALIVAAFAFQLRNSWIEDLYRQL